LDVTASEAGVRPLEIAIIGAGMSGLYMGYRLKSVGIPFTIYEKAGEVGGTWRDNTYPGLHVDVATRSYEFPFARSRTWSRRYAPGTEIRDYLRKLSVNLDLVRHVVFNTEITDAVYADGGWTLTTSAGESRRVDVIYCGTGFLRVPSIPDIPGRDTFTGSSFHSSRWDHSVDLTGKRVGVIGTGSSGLQIVTELGKRGHDVTHFCRTPQWIQVKENPRIGWIERVLLGVPALGRYWDQQMAKLKVKTDGSENWRLRPGPEREEMTRRFLATMEAEVPDPALRAKLTPSYQLGCKRVPKSPDYYRVIQQPNVRMFFGPVTRVEPAGVVDGDGTLHELDVIVYATGFDSHAYMRPMNVTGVGGVTVNDLWREQVYAYRAVALPSMPNFFLLSGPFAPVNSIAIPGSLNDEVGYLLKILDAIQRDRVAFAPTAEVTAKFVAEVADAAALTTYASCDNWYRDRGGAPVLWPWTRAEHAEQYRVFDPDEFDVYPLSERDDTVAVP
jgi:cation diffusion facilitator CzcD-associated flavoprotein CzcO